MSNHFEYLSSICPLQCRTLGQKLGGGGQAYCFGRMTSHISIVLEQKTGPLVVDF